MKWQIWLVENGTALLVLSGSRLCASRRLCKESARQAYLRAAGTTPSRFNRLPENREAGRWLRVDVLEQLCLLAK